jgi:hypothetical protein
MFGVLFKVKVKAEKRQAFIDFIKWDIQVAKEREPGTLSFDLYQDPADENAFFVYEAYRDRKAFVERALRMAKGERGPGVQPKSDASKAAEAGAGHEKATKAKA